MQFEWLKLWADGFDLLLSNGATWPWNNEAAMSRKVAGALCCNALALLLPTRSNSSFGRVEVLEMVTGTSIAHCDRTPYNGSYLP